MVVVTVSSSFFDACLLGIAKCVLVARVPLPKGTTFEIRDISGRKATAEVRSSKKVIVEELDVFADAYVIKIGGIRLNFMRIFHLFGFESLFHIVTFFKKSKNVSMVEFQYFHME